MKVVKFTAAAVLLVSTNYMSYFAGMHKAGSDNVKHYQAACILSDACRNMVDNLGEDADEIYSEYVDNLDGLGHIAVTSDELRNSYSFGY